VWINPAGRVQDSGGVMQTNQRNRRVAINVSRLNSAVSVRILPNPFTPGATIAATGIRGVVIAVAPVNAKAKLPETAASVRIVDLFGKLVFKGDLVRQSFGAPLYSCYYVVWDGRNRDGRIAASGIYQVVVTYTVAGEARVEKRMKLGLHR
jgi:hypothetical protein